jgi:hypothetical protein
MRRVRRISLSLVCGTVIGGCSTRVEPRVWDPVDVERLADQLANPTLELDDEEVAALAEAFQREAPALEETIEWVDCSIRESTGDLSEGDPCLIPEGFAPRGFGLESTSVFARYACPGPDLERPDTTFKFGAMRLVSPGLSEDVIESFEVAGQLLLTFETTQAANAAGRGGCQISDFELLGDAPAYYSVEEEYVALQLDVELSSLMQDETRRLEQVIVAERDTVAVLQFTEPETFAVVRWQRMMGTNEFTVTGASQQYACTVTVVGAVDCTEVSGAP